VTVPARWLLVGAAAVAALAVLVSPARPDTAPIANSSDLPWTNPQHQSSIEVLASQIASTIAGKQVTVRCEGETDWVSLVARSGGDPDSELGFVAFSYVNGQLASLSTTAELAGEKVCLPLKNFAAALSKPTKCRSAPFETVTQTVKKRVRVKRTTTVGGKRRTALVWVTRLEPQQSVKVGQYGPLGPCLAASSRVQQVPPGFWSNYESYATAMLTLAHESIHLSGIVGLYRPATGAQFGDPDAEAKAQCYGMQWLPYVAEQLGDTPDDAQAIADYAWQVLYPRFKNLGNGEQYWSAACVPGGPMDLHMQRASWP
jgi:hypothetical protein